MTNTNTNAVVASVDLSAEFKRKHNLPTAVSIAGAINAGIEAAKQGENATAKLTFAFWQGMTQKIDERGTTLVSLDDSKKFCAPWLEGVTVSDAMRTHYKDESKKFIDDLCVEWSDKFTAAQKVMETLKGNRSSEAAKNDFDSAFKLSRAVRAMVRRAIRCAYYITTLMPEKVNYDEKKGLINIVLENDRHSVTVSVLEDMADDHFPSTAKPKGTDKRDEEKAATPEAGPVESVIQSVLYLRKFVDARRFNTFDAATKNELKELYATLTACFAVKDDTAPVLIKKAKA